MHLYFITKGIKNEVDQFITELQGKYLPFQWREKETDPFINANVQLSVRPIQLWEVGFPKEHYDVVATTILGEGYNGLMGNDGEKPVFHKWINKYVKVFQKLLHIKPLPEFKRDRSMPLRRNAIAFIGLGVKDDYTLPTGVEGL